MKLLISILMAISLNASDEFKDNYKLSASKVNKAKIICLGGVVYFSSCKASFVLSYNPKTNRPYFCKHIKIGEQTWHGGTNRGLLITYKRRR